MRDTSYRYPELITEIKKMDPDILLLQEPVGAKFEGYSIKEGWQFATIPGMKKVTADERGMTGILLKGATITKFQVIPIPNDLFEDHQPQHRIYSSAVKVYLDGTYRGRDYIIYWTGYRTPSREAITMDNIMKIYDFICDYVNDESPTIIHTADYNIRNEIIGSPSRNQVNSTLKYKYEDGDKLIETLYQKGIKIVNNSNQITFSVL